MVVSSAQGDFNLLCSFNVKVLSELSELSTGYICQTVKCNLQGSFFIQMTNFGKS